MPLKNQSPIEKQNLLLTICSLLWHQIFTVDCIFNRTVFDSVSKLCCNICVHKAISRQNEFSFKFFIGSVQVKDRFPQVYKCNYRCVGKPIE